ncbi:flagellar hook-length control protein FliK [Sphingomonas sp. IC-56]|uniref:flagellar hook-length control protein FliK n=1 Tax=Sphingomonas sp. IC-56 TaxID=2898529 RepID=UPI001E62C134|nr:flagellar hook-length control protein FliK [Sphingomonas sp. IC-56]MCD2324227.1 flagellar hook-length control protein FliK [Sphingomonas sp. IC-56]
MQVNAFGFPLGANIAGGNAAAGAPALGFLQALGVAGAGQPTPVGGPAVLPVTSLADAGPTMALTVGAAPGQGFGGAALLPAATPVGNANAATPLLPQGNDALATLTTLPATAAMSATAGDASNVGVLPAAQPSAPEKPILATLQTTTSLSGLLATAVRPATEAPAAPAAVPAELAQPAMAQPEKAQPLGKPAKLAQADAPLSPQPVQMPLIEGNPSVPQQPQAAVAAHVPAKDAAPAKGGKPAKPAAPEADAPAPAPTDAAAQPILTAVPIAAQPVPPQAAAQQAPADAQPQLAARQPRATAGVQANPAETPTRAVRKTGAEPAQQGDSAQTASKDVAGSDFARAVQATGGDNAATSQDGGQPRDPQVKLEGAVASVSQPSHTASAAGTAAATPAAPLPQEPVVATRPGQFGHAMGVEIARKVEAGEETLRVRLNPDNLGRVEVTLAFEDGNLKATVRAESQRALDLLRQDMPDLARTLDQAGVRTDAQSFRFEARADTGGGQQQGNGQQQQRGQNPQQQHAQADDLEPIPAYRAIRADGQVDLLA